MRTVTFFVKQNKKRLFLMKTDIIRGKLWNFKPNKIKSLNF